jgi:hypothetical protein
MRGETSCNKNILLIKYRFTTNDSRLKLYCFIDQSTGNVVTGRVYDYVNYIVYNNINTQGAMIT